MVDAVILQEWISKAEDDSVLLKKCLEKAPDVARLSDDCDLLATFYVETRYPVHWPATFGLERR